MLFTSLAPSSPATSMCQPADGQSPGASADIPAVVIPVVEVQFGEERPVGDRDLWPRRKVEGRWQN